MHHQQCWKGSCWQLHHHRKILWWTKKITSRLRWKELQLYFVGFSFLPLSLSLPPSCRIRVCITRSVTAASTAAPTSGGSSWTRATRPLSASSGCLREPTPPCWITSTRAPTETLQHPQKTPDAGGLLPPMKWSFFYIYSGFSFTCPWGDSCLSLAVRQDGIPAGGSWLNTSVRGETDLWWMGVCFKVTVCVWDVFVLSRRRCGGQSASLPWFCCWLVISHSSPLFSYFFCLLLKFIYCPSFSLYPRPPSLSPSCLSCFASPCTSVSICPHDCIFAHLLHSLSQIPLCLSSSDILPGGRRWVALLLSQSHPDTWVKSGRTTLKINWWIDSPLQPSSTPCSLPRVSHSPTTCSSSRSSLFLSALNVATGSWQRDTPFIPLILYFPRYLMSRPPPRSCAD